MNYSANRFMFPMWIILFITVWYVLQFSYINSSTLEFGKPRSLGFHKSPFLKEQMSTQKYDAHGGDDFKNDLEAENDLSEYPTTGSTDGDAQTLTRDVDTSYPGTDFNPSIVGESVRGQQREHDSDMEGSTSLWMKEKAYLGPPFMNTDPRPLRSDLVTSTVHYFWCKKSFFTFTNYLSVLSALKVLQPFQVVFHYTHLPLKDSYHTWFKELQHHLPQFVLDDLGNNHTCSNVSLKLDSIWMTLEKNGGIFVGENTLITNFTHRDWAGDFMSFWKGKDKKITEGIIIINKKKSIDTTSKVSDGQRCCTRELYDIDSDKCSCLIYSEDIYPKDILISPNKSSQFSRRIAYGTRKPLTPIQDLNSLTPRICHFIWFGNRTFAFSNVLSVLSTLYIAGMEKICFHGDIEPTGRYWEYLVLKHNVSFIFMDFNNVIYNQKMYIPQHSADVAKAYVLLKYGGMTQDGDVYWVSRIPDSLLSYETVLSYDWPKRGNWPETLNLGVVIAKPNSKFLAEFITTYRDNYRPHIWDYNPIRMPYRAYERHPQSVYIYPHLQVMTWGSTSHPTWVPGYIQPLEGSSVGHPFNWRNETLSIHITWPKEIPEFRDFATVHTGSGSYYEIGRLICDKARVDSYDFLYQE